MPELSIIIFAYNEADNIPTVLDELDADMRAHSVDYQLVFVDDGSTDATSDVARATLERLGATHSVIRHPSNRGIGAALKTGVTASTGKFVTFMPADGQIEPAGIRTLLETARTDDFDVVFSIYADRNDGVHRAVLSAAVRGLIRVIHGVAVNSDGPYMFRRAVFLPNELPSDSFFLNFEFPILALRAGLRTHIVSIRCRRRISGASKSTQWRRVAGVARELLELRVRTTQRALRRWV